MKKPKILISGCVITFNEETNIAKCINSMKGLVEEIIIVDSESNDRTTKIAKKLGAKVFLKKFVDYGSQRNFALSKAKGEWIIFLDADESLTPELKKEIYGTLRAGTGFSVFEVPYKNVFYGKELRFGGERYSQPRLFKRNKASYTSLVHEKVHVKGLKGKLKNKIEHNSYHNLERTISFFQKYSLLEAEQRFMKGERFSLIKLLTMPTASFFYRYFFRFGVLDGLRGFIVAIFFAFYRFSVNVWLWEKEFNSV